MYTAYNKCFFQKSDRIAYSCYFFLSLLFCVGFNVNIFQSCFINLLIVLISNVCFLRSYSFINSGWDSAGYSLPKKV